MSTYDAVKDLPLEIESYELEPLEQEVARGFTLRRTDGRAARRRRRGPRRGGRLRPRRAAALPGAPWRAAVRGPPHARLVLRSSSRGRPSTAAGRSSRRRSTWRCGRPGARSARRVGREAQPLRFVVSTRASRTSSGWRALYPELRFKLDPDRGLDATRLIATLAARGRRRHRRLQGHLPRHEFGSPPDPELYARIAAAFPEAWIEDPGADAGDAAPCSSRTASGSRGTRAIHEWSDVEALPFRAALPQLQAVALRLGRAAVRLLRRVRARGHRALRRRPVRARRRPRPDPAARLALPPGRAERRRAGRLQRERAGRRACRRQPLSLSPQPGFRA